MDRFIPLLESKGATSFKHQASSPTHGAKLMAGDNGKAQAVMNGEVFRALEGPKAEADHAPPEPIYVALVKLRAPETMDDGVLRGIATTLSQLRNLGLISVVVVDCDIPGSDGEKRLAAVTQSHRMAYAMQKCDAGARVIDSPIAIGRSPSRGTPSSGSNGLVVDSPHDLVITLHEELIPIVPTLGYTADTCILKPVDANATLIALAGHLAGLQFTARSVKGTKPTRFSSVAEVYRLIIIDPVGGIPANNRATGRHMFLNLEQEFDEVTRQLKESSSVHSPGTLVWEANRHHLRNAWLAKKMLSLLPPTASAIITTPQEAAFRRPGVEDDLNGTFVGTRQKLNPLIHNLLTDKPVQSSSLPSGRFQRVATSTGESQLGSLTTLVKRGLPLTMFPDPRISPWYPPEPGQPALSLRDPSINLPRLLHLIEDSFGLKLDAEDYLRRIAGNLAGIIVAGEYDGGAILTWERPFTVPASEEVVPDRLVPYLDKFAVLRKSQGAGGVADVVFNAMVRDCLPDGVCWRSRKDNPVNKWYFERSRGTLKLDGTDWTMFWTTPELALDEVRYRDYESVCRGIQPSWAG